MGIEHHRKALAAALCVPKHTNLAIASDGIACALDGFVDGEILVVACQNLIIFALVLTIADEVLDDIDEAVFAKHAFKENIVVDDLSAFVHAILGLPLHVAVLARCDGACL